MIIDVILNRKDDEELMAEGYTCVEYPNGKVRNLEYNAREFYNNIRGYWELGVGSEWADNILSSMDNGTEEDVKKALCKYVVEAEYSPAICEYINSVSWLN